MSTDYSETTPVTPTRYTTQSSSRQSGDFFIVTVEAGPNTATVTLPTQSGPWNATPSVSLRTDLDDYVSNGHLSISPVSGVVSASLDDKNNYRYHQSTDKDDTEEIEALKERIAELEQEKEEIEQEKSDLEERNEELAAAIERVKDYVREAKDNLNDLMGDIEYI